MGRVLLQCERDTALPLDFPRLALLLASLLQFATSRQDFVRVQLRNGLCAVVSVDAAASVASAVIFACGVPATGERARLVSLVVLREFLARFRDTVERVVEQNHADAERMAEAYTLSSALEGAARSGDPGDALDGDVGDGTMAPFVGFHQDVVQRLLETANTVGPSTEKTDETLRVLRCYVMNAETSVFLDNKSGATKDAASDSLIVLQVVKRAARALQLAFPLLHQTSQLKLSSTAACDATLSATTLVLRFVKSGGAYHHVLLQMFHYGVFAVVVHYSTDSGNNSEDGFRGRECKLLRDGTLQRVLLSDSRGTPLARLLHEAETASSYSIHLGSDGASPEALAAARRALVPWKVPA